MPISSSPHNMRADRSFPTPDLSDYLFSERISSEAPQANVDCLAYGTPHPDTLKYPNHILVYVSNEEPDKTGKKFITLYYAADRENQDTYNFVFQGFAGGGKYKTITRNYLIRRDDWEANGSLSGDLPDISPGDPDPQATTDTRFENYVYFGDSMQTTGSQELDSVYVMVTRMFRIHCVLTGSEFDSNTGNTYEYSEAVFLTDASTAEIDAILGATVSGEHRTRQAINCDWMVVRQRVHLDVGFSRSYYTYKPYYWPPVLQGLYTFPWNHENGSIVAISNVNLFKRDAYNGLTKMRIQESFVASSSDPSDPDDPMIPHAIRHDGYKFNVSIPACLHGGFNTFESYGSGPVTGSFEIVHPATHYTDWPASLVIESTASPYKGGYILRKVTAYRPETPSSPSYVL